jgi:hypothetical protein
MSKRTMADLRKRHTPATASARITLNSALLAEIERAEEQLEEARKNDDSLAGGSAELARRVVELHEQAQKEEDTFTFQAVGARQWSDMLSQHPPSKEQRAEGLDHDPDPFSRAAMAASAIEPKLTAEDVDWLYDNLSLGQYRRLWGACLAANVGVSGPKAQPSATATRLASGPKSTTALREVSRGASSSAAS